MMTMGECAKIIVRTFFRDKGGLESDFGGARQCLGGV